jgi:hypothetical protein
MEQRFNLSPPRWMWVLTFCFTSFQAFSTETTGFDSRVPLYQQLKPLWGMELSGSLKALGRSSDIPFLTDGKIRAACFKFELQPSFFQKLGVLGFGPSIHLYPVSPIGQVTRAAIGLWSIGSQVRYQARFFREQPLVPYAGYGVERWYYRFVDGSQGRFFAKGPYLGAQFLLNFLDQETAAEFYVNSGVLRSYLVAEIKTLQGSDDLVQLVGSSYYFGIRFEF